ncbi:MAG TPA: hypothetical protein VJ866_07120 [Pyrinomonadaceae bacterium]|nr:hypothetical protein [Pyrinomonadaceae bacterium]
MLRLKSIAAALCAVAALTLFDSTARAQSTLFNIPSTDVVAEKHVYIEFDFVSHLEAHADGGFQAYVPRAVYGVGKHLEVGANVAFLDAEAPGQPVELQPNVKYQFYSNETNGVSAAAGGILYAPVSHRAGADTFGLVYTVVSKKVKGRYGPRITGGGYGLLGRADGNGTLGGAIVGYEQPLHRRVSFVGDWLSGRNRFGYVTPGLSFALPHASALYAGYSIGNVGRKNNALFVYYGITF